MLSASYASLIIGVLLAVILAYLQRAVIAENLISDWLTLTFIVALGRGILIAYYKFAPAHGVEIVRSRLLKFRIGVLCAGALWGASSFLMMPAHHPQHQIFFVFIVAGLTAGAIISFASDLFSATAYALLIQVPLVIRLFAAADELSVAMGISVLLYLGFMLVTLRVLHRNITENFTLRFAAVAREATVRASEERYRLLLEHTPVGIFHYDRDWVITFCNNRFAEILRNSTDKVIGIDMKLLNDSSVHSALKNALAGEIGFYEGEYFATYSDTKLWIELTCAPSRNEQGNIVGGIAIVQDTSERKASADEIRNLAFYDPLTALPNRRLLIDRLQHAIASVLRHHRTGALLFIDLDNFKSLNDNLGHDMGDKFLREVAARLYSCVRAGDTVARIGGDEFVIILEDLSEQAWLAAEQTEIIGEKLLLALNQSYAFDSHEYHSSSSIGVTLLNGDGRGTEELMKQADIAMYQAKKAGGNTLRFFDPQMQDLINSRALLENELRHALEKQQFLLHYQAQVDGKNRILAAEVLLRWQHPERGLLMPDEFIHLAEETGLILPIGKWVVDQACAQLKAWQAHEATRDLLLSVNISAKQFRQVDFVAQMRAAISRYAINPARLKLEITEGMLLENVEAVIVTMNVLKGIGIHFSLDDFGTGYSSLQYLKRLPLNQVKIDQSFVRDLATNNSDKVIVRTIITMAKSMDLEIIAEGVETETQRALLLKKGCHHYQGYYFSRPIPLADFEQLLKAKTLVPVE